MRNSEQSRAARVGTITRNTRETQISVTVNLDGTGVCAIATGIGFLDHMVEQVARHSLIDIDMRVAGDLHIDQHHTVEDSALALGEAVAQALAEKRGIVRYGHAYAPMDETLSRAALDISGRPHLVWKSGFTQERLGEMDTELFSHWFASFAQSAGLTLHLETLYGENNHHIAESLFKALARALRAAVAIDPRVGDAVPSTKGVL
ncbi:MAG: imidazoleglycerol-phosphate dehydratase HisB [Pseudomonadota bacterium]